MNEGQNCGTAAVSVFPGGSRAVLLEGNDTVASVLASAGVSTAGHEVFVNGSRAEAGQAVRNGDRVTATKQVKGN